MNNCVDYETLLLFRHADSGGIGLQRVDLIELDASLRSRALETTSSRFS